MGLAYIDSLAFALERAYVCFRDSLGLPVPLPDRTRGGGMDLIDCYVRAFPEPYLGSYGVDAWTGAGGCSRCVGYFSIATGLRWGWLRRTAAYMTFCLVEDAVNVEQYWWILASVATWSEKIAFPWDTGYVFYMNSWFTTPYLSLWADDYWREYGAAQYWIYLEETQGRSFIPELLQRSCGADGLTVLDEMLLARGSSFNQSLVTNALWCNATGTLDDGLHFRQGSLYPEITCQARHRDFPVEDATLSADSLARAAGSDYIRFVGPGNRASLRVRVDGSPRLREQRAYSFVITRDGTNHQEYTTSPDADGDAVCTVPDWPGCDYATLIVTNYRDAAGDLSFRYTAEETGAPTPPAVLDLACAPNPFRETTRIRFLARGLTRAPGAAVFDLSGRRIAELAVVRNYWGEYIASWNGSDGRLEPVPRGCYFIRANAGSATAATKVLFWR